MKVISALVVIALIPASPVEGVSLVTGYTTCAQPELIRTATAKFKNAIHFPGCSSTVSCLQQEHPKEKS